MAVTRFTKMAYEKADDMDESITKSIFDLAHLAGSAARFQHCYTTCSFSLRLFSLKWLEIMLMISEKINNTMPMKKSTW